MVGDITPDDISRVKEVLLNIPVNFQYKNNKLAMTAVAERNKKYQGRTRAPRSIDSDMIRVMALFQWAFDQWYTERNLTAPGPT